MPYPNERASRLGHTPLATSAHVQNALARWTYPEADPGAAAALVVAYATPLATLASAVDRQPTQVVIAFDGSPQEVAARIEYPSVKVGYVQIGASALRVADYLASRRNDGLVDVTALRRSYTSNVVNTVLPSTGLSSPGRSDRQTWRDELYRSFSNQVVTDFGGRYSLVDALMTTHGQPGTPAATVSLHRCPECEHADPAVPREGGPCPACREPLYPTDVLRTHEEFASEGSNAVLLTRVMNVAERLLVIAYLEGFWGSPAVSPDTIGALAFVTDGPLALYGPTAPLRSRMLEYWQALVDDLRANSRALPLWVGIEKSGAFVDHAHVIKEGLQPGYVLPLSNAYIKTHVVPGSTAAVYGKDEFFGRRFVYRTGTGAVLVVSLPRTTPTGVPYGADPACEALASYGLLKPSLDVLDVLQSRMYEDAEVPLLLAHNAASLPLGTGRSVLTLLAQEHLGMPLSHLVARQGQAAPPY